MIDKFYKHYIKANKPFEPKKEKGLETKKEKKKETRGEEGVKDEKAAERKVDKVDTR